jgi:hypothetical protein
MLQYSTYGSTIPEHNTLSYVLRNIHTHLVCQQTKLNVTIVTLHCKPAVVNLLYLSEQTGIYIDCAYAYAYVLRLFNCRNQSLHLPVCAILCVRELKFFITTDFCIWWGYLFINRIECLLELEPQWSYLASESSTTHHQLCGCL